jgi:hypothetical protein
MFFLEECQNINSEEVKMNANKITFTNAQLKTLLKVLKGLARHCRDVCIEQGIIRQLSNDRSVVFEVDLRSILGNLTFVIAKDQNIPNFLRRAPKPITIEGKLNEFFISNPYGPYWVRFDMPQLVNNRFISEKELESSFCQFLREENLLIRIWIEKIVLKCIRIGLKVFKEKYYKLNFSKYNVEFLIEEIKQHRRRKSKKKKDRFFIQGIIMEEIPLFQPINGHVIMPSLPFESFDYDENFLWEVYYINGEFLISKVSGPIGEVEAIVYMQNKLIIPQDYPKPQNK